MEISGHLRNTLLSPVSALQTAENDLHSCSSEMAAYTHTQVEVRQLGPLFIKAGGRAALTSCRP